MNIPYNHDNTLVRGLDYYSHTTFEIISSALGAQDALCGGGRYNGLIEQLGGDPTPAIGFAAGVERLILSLQNQVKIHKKVDIYLVHMGNDITPTAVRISNDLRKHCGKTVILETLRRSMKAQMREAGRCGAEITLILGEDEFIENNIIIKNMDTGSQEKIALAELIQYFNSQIE